jgi:hypothetical protein
MTIAISKDLVLINVAAFLRSLLVGLTGVVLGIYLFRVGLSSLNIGLVLGAGLAGAAAATVVVLMRGKVAVALLLLRDALVEMDVPTRQSYVAAVVQPTERTFASGATNLARNVFWAVGSSLAGLFMQNVSFSTPLVMGGGLKIGYDLLLYGSFRKLRPPEER